jgi:peptide/nickel transport system substrate-binding protein
MRFMTRRPNRGRPRRLIYAGALLGVTAAMAGCGGTSGSASGSGSANASSGSSSTPLTGNTQSAACTGTPVRGGSLTYARQLGPATLNPFAPTNSQGDIFADSIIYQPLVQPDPKGGSKLVGGVADKWSVSKDGKTLIFHIRSTAKFSNGTPVTAQDVKFTLDKFADPKWNLASVLAAGYKSADIINSSTVKVHLSQPTPGILWNMAIFDAYIVPAKLVQSEGKTAFFNHPVGSGPFMVQSWQRGSSITFARNPYYWEQGLPYLNKVTYDYAQDDNSRILELESGRAQMADGIPFSQVSQIKATSSLALQTAKVPYWLGLWMNHQRPQYRDLDVRQAMQYALNKDLINSKIYAGLGTIPNSILPQLIGDASSSQVKPYPYDLAKAKQLMAKSKFPHGFSTTLQYPAGYATYSTLALILQAEWAQIGIKVTLRSVDQTAESSSYMAGNYDLTFPYAQFSSDVPIPDEYAAFVALPDGDHSFFSWWTDPAIAGMVTKYLHTEDQATRTQMWPQIQQAMLTQTPVINILDLPFVNAHRTNVCGTYLNALGADSLQYTWIRK